MSPELLDPKLFGFQDFQKTKNSDCYALGMVIFEVLSGQIPFVGDRDVVVIRNISEGKHPERPENAWFTDDVWGMLKCCWEPKPLDRPGLEFVLPRLENASASWTPPSHPAPSIANSSKTDLSDREGIPAVDVSRVPSPSQEALSKSVHEPTVRGPSSGPDNTQVRSVAPARTPVLLLNDHAQTQVLLDGLPHIDRLDRVLSFYQSW